MQFHLEGYKHRNPYRQSSPDPNEPVSFDTLPPTVDVLIIGSGPAGLLLAAQLSQFPSLTVRLIERKPSRLSVGQADGIQCRTIEIFEAFGFSDRVLREAYWVNETVFWRPSDDQNATDGGASVDASATSSGGIVRSGRIRDVEEGLSEFPHVILNQARIHDFFLDVMRDSASRLQPTFNRQLLDLKIDLGHASRTNDTKNASGPTTSDTDTQDTDYPVTVTLQHNPPNSPPVDETIRARYIIGCDGARSTVRSLLRLSLTGDSANQAWGVIDLLCITDFPDIRYKCVIQGGEAGNILIIPREGGYMVRMYIELDKLSGSERIGDRKDIDAEYIIGAAKRILRPYVLHVKEVVWWSVYEIGQRLCERFDDLRSAVRGGIGEGTPRVFIAGDACHTHSPKAGQGMNVSMQDTFNLGWKLAAVIQGRAMPELLSTYSEERQAIAKDLIDFDREFARLFSAKAKKEKKEKQSIGTVGNTSTDRKDRDDEDDVDPAEFQKAFEKAGHYTAGMGTCYSPSLITMDATHQALAAGYIIGKRFHSYQMIRLADAKPVHLGHTVRADGRWRLFLFNNTEDPRSVDSKLAEVCAFLSSDEDSIVRKYTRRDEAEDAVIDVRGVLQAHHGHTAVNLPDLPDLLRPTKGKFRLVDHEKVFCDEPEDSRPRMSIYDARGVDAVEGVMVLVRPDQYVSGVLPLNVAGCKELSRFFEKFMIAV